MKIWISCCLVLLAIALSGCPAVEVRCKCPEPSQKVKPYTGPPEIHEVGGESGRR